MRAIVTDDETIVNNKVTVLATFDGEDAVEQAVVFIIGLPNAERGRYGIDACIPEEGAHCDGCDCLEVKLDKHFSECERCSVAPGNCREGDNLLAKRPRSSFSIDNHLI